LMCSCWFPFVQMDEPVVRLGLRYRTRHDDLDTDNVKNLSRPFAGRTVSE